MSPNGPPPLESPLTIGLLVVCALILSICVLCCLLFFVRTAMAKRRKKRKRDGKHGGKGADDLSRRSTSMAGPGALSVGSRRSTGGLTPGKPLSVAQGGSPATARSRGVASHSALTAGSAASKRSAGNVKGGGSLSAHGAPHTARSSNVHGGGKQLTEGGNMAAGMVTARSAMKAGSHSDAHGNANMITARSDMKAHKKKDGHHGGAHSHNKGQAVTR